MKRLIVILLAALVTGSATADVPAADILARVDAYRSPLASFAIDVELTSVEGTKSSSSKFRVYGKGSDRSVVEFLAPSSDRGRYLLMLRDAMWIYLPSASRPIRISPLQRLMGQASNGDVARTSFSVDYDAAGVTDEGGSWIVDLTAKDPAVAYKRVRLWVDKATYEPRRADFYVASGKLIKRAHFREYGQLGGRRAVTAVEIEDLLRSGSRTVMRYSNLVARDNPDKLFTKDALGKW